MDNNVANSNAEQAAAERSGEEVAWDQEFAEESNMGFASGIADMAKLTVKVPVAILQMPLSLIPEETARHTRAALRETFLAFRSLLGALGDGIENMLADPAENPATVSGPTGTWGTGRSTQSKSTSTAAASTGGRARRIELSDSDVAGPTAMPDLSGMASLDSADEEEDAGEGRGLKADIDY